MSRALIGAVGATLTVAALFVPATATAQDTAAANVTPIATDRPSQSAGPGTVPRLAFQVESGWKFSRRQIAGIRTDFHDAPDLLLRFGLTDALELRTTATGWTFKSSTADGGEPQENGFGDIVVGVKSALLPGDGVRPAVSLLMDVNVPVGSPDFTNDYANPQVLLLFTSNLAAGLDLTYNIGPQVVFYDDDGTRRAGADLNYTAMLSRVLTDTTTVFGELFGGLPLSESRNQHHTLQGGLMVLLGGRAQLDARAGVGLVDEAADWLMGLGFSFRLPR